MVVRHRIVVVQNFKLQSTSFFRPNSSDFFVVVVVCCCSHGSFIHAVLLPLGIHIHTTAGDGGKQVADGEAKSACHTGLLLVLLLLLPSDCARARAFDVHIISI